MTREELITLIITLLLGSTGFAGVIFKMVTRYIDKKLAEVEEEARKKQALKARTISIDNELQHAYGRMFFWMHSAIVKGEHNGELEDAFRKLQTAEEKKKALDNELIAHVQQELQT